ncbi:unnamed protein product [Onchocerca flexuosa]|uniref:Uncharacterized protein n=1 Tax=Onchocerca flexuosa TaxID=387005 RepID=A0A183HVC1_9BILA|nr:unnamed protein product [Onchocerca flexuosa]
MLNQRLFEQKHKPISCDLRSKSKWNCKQCSASAVFGERAAQQRLQELDVEKREPILLRCSALHHARFVQINTLQRTSEIYKVLHEFHSALFFVIEMN